jgi:hypothetical protein
MKKLWQNHFDFSNYSSPDVECAVTVVRSQETTPMGSFETQTVTESGE